MSLKKHEEDVHGLFNNLKRSLNTMREMNAGMRVVLQVQRDYVERTPKEAKGYYQATIRR